MIRIQGNDPADPELHYWLLRLNRYFCLQAVHERLKLYECPSCAYKTSHGSAYKRHIATIHNRVGQELYGCESCDYQTLHKSALKRHQAQKHNKDGLVSYKCSGKKTTMNYL